MVQPARALARAPPVGDVAPAVDRADLDEDRELGDEGVEGRGMAGSPGGGLSRLMTDATEERTGRGRGVEQSLRRTRSRS